jgi:hypothetical protein
MNIAASNVIIKIADAPNKFWIDSDAFYVVADNGAVTVWAVEEDEAIQIGARHPGTSGKSAATIANDIYGA